MIFETERLSLTPLAITDSPFLYRFMSDAEVMAHWDRPAIDDPDAVDAAVAAEVAEMQAGTALYWSTRLRSSGAFLGYCELVEIDRRRHQAELGVIIDREAWGLGYATEALAAVLAHCASPLGLKRLLARTHVGDGRAEHLLQKLGFKPNGYLNGHVGRDGERRDCRLFAFTI